MDPFAAGRHPMDMGATVMVGSLSGAFCKGTLAWRLGHTLHQNCSNCETSPRSLSVSRTPIANHGYDEGHVDLNAPDRRATTCWGWESNVAASVEIIAEAEGVTAVGHCARSRDGNRAASSDID